MVNDRHAPLIQTSDAAVQTPSFMMLTCAVYVCIQYMCVHLPEWKSARQSWCTCPSMCLCDVAMGLLGQEILIKANTVSMNSSRCGNTYSTQHFYCDKMCVF